MKYIIYFAIISPIFLLLVFGILFCHIMYGLLTIGEKNED